MNARTRARSLIAGIAALTVLTVGACSSDGTEASDSSSSSSSAPAATDAAVSGTTPTADATAAVPGDGSLGAADGESLPAQTLPDGPPPATTEVPPPGGDGNITETVPATSRATAAAVPLTETAEAGDGVEVALESLETLTTQAELPGEISGPGLKVTVSVTNGSDAPLDLVNVVVDLQDAAGTPAISMIAEPAAPFRGALEPGASATGVYVFTLPDTYTGPATIAVSYSTAVPVVLFTGDTP